MTGQEIYDMVRANRDLLKSGNGEDILADMLLDMGQEEAADLIRARGDFCLGSELGIENFFRKNFDAKREDFVQFSLDKNIILLVRKKT